jgi:hypothetical protein
MDEGVMLREFDVVFSVDETPLDPADGGFDRLFVGIRGQNARWASGSMRTLYI